MSKTVRLVTPVPGPKSKALLARREAAVPRGVANVTPIFAASASGATLTDVDGNVFIDFAGGIGVVNIGHGHPEVTAAIHAQVDKQVIRFLAPLNITPAQLEEGLDILEQALAAESSLVEAGAHVAD